jgi:hypothetical protein
MYLYLHNIINPMHIQQLTKVILQPIQNTLGIYKQIIILIFYQVAPRLVIPLTFIYASVQVSKTSVKTNKDVHEKWNITK